MRLKDKVAIITGGANGIGFAAAERFSEEGAQVVIVDFDESAGAAALKKINEKNKQARFIQADVSNKESVTAMVEQVIDHYGKVDILINNAGITQDATLKKMTEAQFDRVIQVNLKGVYLCAQAVMPHMAEQGAGKIVNTASVSGVYGNFGQTNYAAAKAGIIGMTKSWAKELGRKGINVNAVAPGFTLTEMVKKMPEKVTEKMKQSISLGRLGQPEDIANAYLFLASQESDYVHGHVLHVDGGIQM